MSIQATPETHQAPGVTPSAPWRIKALSILPGYRLAVTFMDGTNGIVDLSGVATAHDCGVFAGLKELAMFEQARLELGVVTWPNGADIDPAWMYEELKAGETWSVPF
ncbi:MAG: DUF2442 domain-containing protein [Pseudomonadota bacterium]